MKGDIFLLFLTKKYIIVMVIQKVLPKNFNRYVSKVNLKYSLDTIINTIPLADLMSIGKLLMDTEYHYNDNRGVEYSFIPSKDCHFFIKNVTVKKIGYYRRCSLKGKSIVFNRAYTKKCINMPLYEYIDTVLHGIASYISYELYYISFNKAYKNHGNGWKSVCRAIGAVDNVRKSNFQRKEGLKLGADYYTLEDNYFDDKLSMGNLKEFCNEIQKNSFATIEGVGRTIYLEPYRYGTYPSGIGVIKIRVHRDHLKSKLYHLCLYRVDGALKMFVATSNRKIIKIFDGGFCIDTFKEYLKEKC